MIGYFNMVESLLERSTLSYSHLMGLKEELAWANIKKSIILIIILVEAMDLFIPRTI